MAVLVTNGTMNLSDVNGFYKAEQYNMPGNSVEAASLGTTSTAVPRVWDVTFTSASANAKGIILCVYLGGAITTGAASTSKDIDANLLQIMGSCTADASADTITYSSHGLSDGARVALAASTIPGGLVAGQVYFVRDATTNTFKLSDTSGGTAINITSTGSSVVLWKSIANNSKTGNEMFNSRSSARGYYFVDFEFDTPAAIDNTASKYRVAVCRRNTGSETTYILLSGSGQPAVYALYTDATASFTSGTAGTATLTFTGNAADGNTVSIGGTTYTFHSSISSYIYYDKVVVIGATTADTITNLYNAINNSGGTKYSDYTAANAHEFVSATAKTATTLTITAKKTAHGLTSLALAETLSNASWGASTLSGATAGDTIWVRSQLTLDQDAAIGGLHGAGDSAQRVAMVICRGSNPTPDNVSYLRASPTSPVTITIDGAIIIGSHSGYQFGTAASPIAISNQLTLSWPPPSSGTRCGINHVGSAYNSGSGSTARMYGEYPTNSYSNLAYDVFPGSSVYSVNTTADTVSTQFDWAITTAVPVRFMNSGGSLPGGLSAGVTYWLWPTSSTSYEVYDTYAHAMAHDGTGKVDITSSGTGTNIFYSVIIVEDATGWSVGDYIAVAGNRRVDPNDYSSDRQIAEISGNEIIPTTPMLNKSYAAGNPVVNCKRGIRLLSDYINYATQYIVSPSNLEYIGVEFDGVGGVYQGSGGAVTSSNLSYDDAANRRKHVISYCSVHTSSTVANRTFLAGALEAPPEGFELSYSVCGRGGSLGSISGVRNVSSNMSSGVVDIKYNIVANSYWNGFSVSYNSMPLFSCNIENNYFHGLYFSSNPGLMLYGSGHNIENNKFWGWSAAPSSGVGALTFYTVNNITGGGNTFDYCVSGIHFAPGLVSNVRQISNVYGVSGANTDDITASEGVLIDYEEGSCVSTPTVNTANLAACPAGTVIKFKNFDGTSGDHRTYNMFGKYVSSSGKLLGSTYNTTNTHYTQYKFLGGALTGVACSAKVKCQIQNSAYYAGTNTLPKLTSAYASETAEVDTATATTDEQVLLTIFTPASDNGELVITLSQKTDAAEANSGVLWSDLVLSARKYGYVFGSIEKSINETINYYWGELVPGIADGFITEINSTTVGAYTGIAINHGTQTVTIDEAHSINELYDYAKYDLCQSANLDKDDWFTTIDGTTYSSSYDIVVDGVVLSGSGKVISMPSNSFSATNGGSTSAQITDENGTLTSLTLTGLVAGSEVRMYKESDSSEYSGGTESCSTTHAFNFQHTGDVAVFIVVLNLGYEPMRISGITLTADPQSIPVSQRIDRVYSNPA